MRFDQKLMFGYHIAKLHVCILKGWTKAFRISTFDKDARCCKAKCYFFIDTYCHSSSNFHLYGTLTAEIRRRRSRISPYDMHSMILMLAELLEIAHRLLMYIYRLRRILFFVEKGFGTKCLMCLNDLFTITTGSNSRNIILNMGVTVFGISVLVCKSLSLYYL